MSKELNDIRDSLSHFSAQFGPSTIVPAEVLAVNDDDTIAVRLASGLEVDDARLKSVVKDGNKVLFIPKVGSIVQLARIENSHEYLVIAVEEITSVIYLVNNARFEMDENGFLIKKGDENLRKLMTDLLDAILSEKHNTYFGPTASLTPESVLKFQDLKTRAQNLLKDA